MKIARKKRRRRDPLGNAQDFWCVLMADLGQSTDSIERETGLTPGQIQYLLKRMQTKRSDFRQGKNPVIRNILQSAQDGVVVVSLRDMVTKRIRSRKLWTDSRAKAKLRTGGFLGKRRVLRAAS